MYTLFGCPSPTPTSGICKCLNIVINASLYSKISNKQIYKGLEIPFFADQIRSQMKCFKLMSAGLETPCCGNLNLTVVSVIFLSCIVNIGV